MLPEERIARYKFYSRNNYNSLPETPWSGENGMLGELVSSFFLQLEIIFPKKINKNTIRSESQ